MISYEKFVKTDSTCKMLESARNLRWARKRQEVRRNYGRINPKFNSDKDFRKRRFYLNLESVFSDEVYNKLNELSFYASRLSNKHSKRKKELGIYMESCFKVLQEKIIDRGMTEEVYNYIKNNSEKRIRKDFSKGRLDNFIV